jgi:hypothetical protein
VVDLVKLAAVSLLLTMTHSRKMSPLGMPSSEAAATCGGYGSSTSSFMSSAASLQPVVDMAEVQV